ncbi:hypothetical protein ASZ90_009279 [hydrocarbon metagenome]|uniref:GyrI-like small molecule binding domain-containing protein n=1 Tax=hydrocarbon metagenome TaxID=938273 RepID=A0A0W8FJA2_9ZZZZ|nr:GyrI-like domain-containing protein [Methanomicrobiaceae archaeon]
MKKIDLKRELKPLYSASPDRAVLVDVPEMQFLMADGAGDPNTSEEYREAIEALYTLSYTLKFMIRKGELDIDYSVMPLEGLWWAEEMARFSPEAKEEWLWRSMIMQPAWVTEDLVDAARRQAAGKKHLPGLSRVVFGRYREGLSAQILHVGPYSAEGPTVARLHRFIEEQGYLFNGKHHEIYLSDPRRAMPERLKTIIRQPVRQSEG